jgi:hypothetical protein
MLTSYVPDDERDREISVSLAGEYFEKVVHTLKILMKLLGVEFHFDQIYERHKNSRTIECVLILMNRC